MNDRDDDRHLPDGSGDPTGPPDPTGLHDAAEQRDDEQQARVSRLLAAAAPDPAAGMPPAVAARLDEVLAGLVSERDPGAGHVAAGQGPAARAASPTDLESRRRRRWPTLLVAAATVSVVGLGIGNLVDDLSGVGSSQSATDEAMAGAAQDSGVDRDGAGQPEAAASPEAPSTLQDGVTDTGPARTHQFRSDAAAAAPRLRTDSLVVDLQRIEDFSLAAAADGSSRALRRACVQPEMGPDDQWVQVRLDGDPAVLVLRAPEGGRRTADVFTCEDADTPAASVRVDTR